VALNEGNMFYKEVTNTLKNGKTNSRAGSEFYPQGYAHPVKNLPPQMGDSASIFA